MDTLQRILERDKQLDAQKYQWLPMYEMISEYIMHRRVAFVDNQQTTPQQFIPDRVFDSTAASANLQMASSLIGALWPGGEKTFRLIPPRTMAKETARSEEVKRWYEDITEVLQDAIDNSASGFQTAQEEYMNDQGSFGISGVGCFDNFEKNPHAPLQFFAMDVRSMSVSEGADGLIDTIYIKKWLTVRQVCEMYGFKHVSEATKSRYRAGQYEDKVKILHAIEPRNTDDIPFGLQGSQAMPIASYIIEMSNNHIIHESGYPDMPAFVTRFIKIIGETYGRSPGMFALPDILEINSMREAAIIAVEKFLDPPLLIDPDQMVGNNNINTSAGALNVKKMSGRSGPHERPVEPMIVVGELSSTHERIQELERIIEDMFYNDDLRDLNNDQRMTLGEANIRDRLRGQALVNIYKRQLNEFYTRIIERAFNILLSHGLFGYIEGSSDYNANMGQDGSPPMTIPNDVADLMLSGKDAYRIYFVCPAARIMRSDELTGLQQTIAAVNEIAPVNVAILDCIDFDEAVIITQELTGAPTQILRSPEKIKAIRDGRTQAQTEQLQAVAREQAAHTAKAAAQAAKAATEAGIDPMAVLGGG